MQRTMRDRPLDFRAPSKRLLFSMLTWIKRRTANRANATNLYGRVVTQARLPRFYQSYGVSDTTEGRFELVVLHLWLPLERLRVINPEGIELSRLSIETFVTDLDDCMREMGVGDLTVPKKVKGAAAAFYARSAGYRTALAEADDQHLRDVLRAAFGENADVDALARYVRAATGTLASQPVADVLAGRINFPEPPATP